MHRKLTITIDDGVYRMLKSSVGPGKISQYLENLAKNDLGEASLEAGYKAMAADKQREKEAKEWGEGLISGEGHDSW